MTTDHIPTTLAERMRQGDELVGLIVKMPNPSALEIAGHLGFDFVLIDTEHGGWDSTELEHHIRAADSAGIDVIVRVGGNDPLPFLRAFDAGSKGVVAPHVMDAADAADAVQHSHYPPVGRRGLAASTRAGRQSTGTLAEHIERARRETMVIAQVEDAGAVANVRAMAQTPHIDAIWLGPTDLSMSLGHPGDLAHPEVQRAIDSVVRDVLGTPSTALWVVLDHEDQVQLWRARGAAVVLFIAGTLQVQRFRDALTTTRRTFADGPSTEPSEDPSPLE